MNSNVRCFLLEPTDRCARYLRRFNNAACPSGAYRHNAKTRIEDGTATMESEKEWVTRLGCDADRIVNAEDGDFIWRCLPNDLLPADDPRWPTTCACGYTFTPEDDRQLFTDVIYRRSDTGQEMVISDAPPGALWKTPYYKKFYAPTYDGEIYTARCPGGDDWVIDGRAANCAMPDDDVHKCWVRSGVAPNFTVGKDGVTCAAGAGSIKTSNWHGFLRNGEFVTC